jgi:dTMP kinase
MSDRRENSVLVALRELRGIEDERVKREQEEARARLEAERAAKEAAALRAREEEEQRRLAEEDRLRRIEEEKFAKVRDEQLRVEEAERRARIEGEMKLQEERMRLEIQSRAGKSPMKLVLGVTLAAALVGGVIVYKIQADNRTEMADKALKAQQEHDRAMAAERAAFQAELQKKIAAITRDMDEKLKSARSEAERSQIIAEARARKEAAAEDRGRGRKRGGIGGGSDQPAKPGVRGVPGKRAINDNLLDGL